MKVTTITRVEDVPRNSAERRGRDGTGKVSRSRTSLLSIRRESSFRLFHIFLNKAVKKKKDNNNNNETQ